MNEPQPLTPGSVDFVVRNMRECDREEIYATRWTDDPAHLAAACLSVPDFAWVYWHEGVPATVIGAIPRHPNVWSVYAFGTNDFEAVAMPMSRLVRRVMIPNLMAFGVIRAECHSIVSHTKAHAWLEMLGAKRESTCKGLGRNGEDFYCYRWLKEDIHVRRRG